MSDDRKHAWLKALGGDEFPPRIRVSSDNFRLIKVFKHDFFAATGLYELDPGSDSRAGTSSCPTKVVLKVGRTRRLFVLPMRPIGRWLARREGRCYDTLKSLEGVPAYLGIWNEIGIIHEYIEGHPLRKSESVNDEFFPRLEALLKKVHAHDMAYVDLEKRENILVGDDGKPYLIDFQISFGLFTKWWKYAPFSRFLLRRLQRSDDYHLLKHRRRHRPDQLTPEQIAASYKRPLYIEIHRMIFRPLTQLRRAILRLLLGDKFQPRHEEKKAAMEARQQQKRDNEQH